MGGYWTHKCTLKLTRLLKILIKLKNYTKIFKKKIQIDKKLEPGIRVTVKRLNGLSKKLRGIIVSPEVPRIELGLYWGYQVRYADSFGKILSGIFNFNLIRIIKLFSLKFYFVFFIRELF